MNPPNVADTKVERFNIRATKEEKSLVEQAARARHVNSSQFVLQAALSSAEQVLAEQTSFSLEPKAWDEFVALLDRPAREIPELKRAMAEPSPFGDR
ncbi:MAG: DUF1778 domain-containing protein [Coriobacteriia bacterium]